MPTRPAITNVQIDEAEGLLILTYDQDIVVPGEINLGSIKGLDQAENPIKSGAVEDINDDTLTLDYEADAQPSGLVSAPGRLTSIEDLGVRGQVGGLPAYPFVNRRGTPYLLSLTPNGDGTAATLVWSEPLTRDVGGATTDITFRKPGGASKKLLAVTAGDTTATWTISTQAAGIVVPESTYTVVANTGTNTNDTGNVEADGTL